MSYYAEDMHTHNNALQQVGDLNLDINYAH